MLQYNESPRLLYKWTEHWKSTKDHNGLQNHTIKVNNSKLIDLVIRIALTRVILMLWFSNFQRKSIINFRMFLYLETYFLRVTVSLLCRLQAVLLIHVQIYPYQISKGRRIVRPCDQHSNETVTLRKRVTKYKNMRNGWSNFFKKIENRVQLKRSR